MQKVQQDPTYFDKLTFLTRLVFSRPKEAVDRISRTIGRNVDSLTRRTIAYKAVSFEECVERIAQTLNRRPGNHTLRLQELEGYIQKKSLELEHHRPFALSHNGDYALGRLCYMACALLQPKVVIETGTAYGVTTSFILSALHLNGEGKLASVDVPPIGKDADRFIGYFIPDHLRSRWRLVRGTSRQHLAPLLRETDGVDLFVHDSEHTYRNMTFEFNVAFSNMSRPGILISDDVNGNSAFAEFIERTQPQYAGIVREPGKDGLGGVAVYT